MSNTDPSRSIKVLVVDQKNDFHAYFAQLRHFCSFEVTSVDHSGAALRLLSENNNEFDLLMIDNDMTDVDIHTFLRLTRTMDVLSIVMSDQENDALVVEAFKSGAFLVLKRPLTIEAVRLIYQDVIRERMHKNDKHKNKIIMYVTPEVVIQEDKSSGDNKKDSGELTKQLTRTNFDNNLVVQSADNDYDDRKKRICMEWTPELHEKFRNAINHLGEGRCFPKEIVRRMGVPGLTRMQVASHLQKYRNERLKYDDNQRMPTYEGYLRGVNESEFGYMPSIKTHQNDHENGLLIGINTSIKANNMNNQTYWSSVMNGPSQENNAEPTPYAPFPIENGIESNQHEGFNNGIIEPGFEGFEGFDDLADFFSNLN